MAEYSQNIKDMVRAAAEKNVSRFSDNFDAVLKTKISDEIDQRRGEVAGTFFAPPEETSSEGETE